MVVVKDLEGIVTKLAWFAKVWGQAWVSMEFLLIDGSDHALSAQGMRVVPVQLIPDPFTDVDGVIFHLIGDSDQVPLHQIVLHPSEVPHYSFFSFFSIVSPRRVPNISLRACATQRSRLDARDFDVFFNCSFSFSFFS